ncbi:ankyrin repeat domain-containing protein [Legionella bononiensis]|uniref:Ankyrin repeat domain-containing protein n=1 Tax=Legionella bononiensis TaxID=2793102 RepID=A0ABS1W8M0_9GAMM|nr:ankyrin repeat domain-containing protein [Legionella bononiensis]MBL7479801.1 ankyrin repeat domain-containing protein [Legionella bononiensis]MBL7525684.1 ankyrin repeat domain-containing protein [Legionella bononiensis]MBL7561867.1 ankyrin repeat domain-containing protein [Legionella bononiensis]
MKHDTSLMTKDNNKTNARVAATSHPADQSAIKHYALTDESWEILNTDQFNSKLSAINPDEPNPYRDAVKSATTGYDKLFCDYPDSSLALIQDYLRLYTSEHQTVPEGKLGTVIEPNRHGREFYGVLFNQNKNLLAVCPGGKGSAAIILFEKMPNGIINTIDLSVGRYSTSADNIIPFAYSSYYCATIVPQFQSTNSEVIEFNKQLMEIKKLISAAVDGTLAPEKSLSEQLIAHIQTQNLGFTTTRYAEPIRPSLFNYLKDAHKFSFHILERLISNGADLEERNEQGLTPLQTAIYQHSNPDLIDFLLKKGAKPITTEEIVDAVKNQKSIFDITLLLQGTRLSSKAFKAALKTAIEHNQEPIALFLIEEYNYKLNSSEDLIALIATKTTNDNRFNILKTLLFKASKISWNDPAIIDAIEQLSKNNNPKSFQQLNQARLKGLCEEAVKNANRDAVLVYVRQITDRNYLEQLVRRALWTDNILNDEAFQVMHQKGIKPNLNSIYTYFDKPQHLGPFMSKEHVNVQHKISITEKKLDRYIKAGLDINQFDERIGKVRNTFLMKAVLANDYDAVQLLITKNASVNLQMTNGNSALMLAVKKSGKHDTTKIIKALINAGADLTLKRTDGKQAIDLLPTSSNPEIQKRLDEIALLLQNHPSITISPDEDVNIRVSAKPSDPQVIANEPTLDHSKTISPDEDMSAPATKLEQTSKSNIALNMKKLDDKISDLALRRKQALAAHNFSEFKSLNEAHQVAITLKSGLQAANQSYLIHQSYATYRNETKALISTAHKTLDQHRGWSEFLVNLSLALLGGVGLVIKGVVNLASNKNFFFVHQTNSSKMLDHIEEQINNQGEEVKQRPY